MVEKIPLADLTVQRLSEKHIPHFNNFICFEKELVDFLKEDALNNEEKSISVTYLWFYQNQLAGYITLLTDRLSLSPDLKVKFKNEGINYKSIPALKIGRLCVDDRFTRRDIGTHMVEFAIRILAQVNEKIGCRFLTLDAKEIQDKEKDPKHFYKKLGFEVLKQREKGSTSMYKDCIKAIAEFRQKSSSS